MIIGKGIVANRFLDYSLKSNYFVFVGGVNDVSVQSEMDISDEEKSLAEALSKKSDIFFVYFSTCNIEDKKYENTIYIKHKLHMEEMVKNTAKQYLIVRLPSVFGVEEAFPDEVKGIFDAINAGEEFDVPKHESKNIIDVDDVYAIVGELLKKNTFFNKVINVAGLHSVSTLSIVRSIEKFVDKKAKYKLLDEGRVYEVDTTIIEAIVSDLKIVFNDVYFDKVLKKYFSHFFYNKKVISIIVPTYNEENGIDEFYRRIKYVLMAISPRFKHEIIFVNDFSTDGTYNKLLQIAENDTDVKLVNFSRNFGNQIGITAGIDYSKGDLAVIIDDDLQDPPEVILNFITKWDEGYRVVYGVRPKREGVNPFFKATARLYYRLIGSLSDTEIPNDTGDFRLIDRVVIESLKEIKEENRYYRGLVAWVGFSQIGVVYDRDKRFAGESTFSFKKYANFAVNGLTSFTEKPLYFSSLAGVFITFISFVLAVTLIISKILDPAISIQGWTSLTVVILFFGGIQLLSIGVLGVYISKIYREVKGRPLYIVESTKNLELRDGDE